MTVQPAATANTIKVIESAPPDTAQVTVVPSGQSFEVMGDETLLGKAQTLVVADVDIERFSFDQQDGRSQGTLLVKPGSSGGWGGTATMTVRVSWSTQVPAGQPGPSPGLVTVRRTG